jgi:death-on-curing protein
VEIRFLTLEVVTAIHLHQIEQYGGAQGLRDLHLLLSAISVPAATFDGKYLHGTLAEMAAAYLFHLVRNHPFVDGNKRVGAAAAAIFLEMNGAKLNSRPDDYTELVLSVAKSERSKAEVAAFFAANTVPL